jgi:hypothetical protein
MSAFLSRAPVFIVDILAITSMYFYSLWLSHRQKMVNRPSAPFFQFFLFWLILMIRKKNLCFNIKGENAQNACGVSNGISKASTKAKTRSVSEWRQAMSNSLGKPTFEYTRRAALSTLAEEVWYQINGFLHLLNAWRQILMGEWYTAIKIQLILTIESDGYRDQILEVWVTLGHAHL